MDIWDYLTSLRRWWWIPIGLPIIAFALAWLVLFPTAPWQSSWTTLITFSPQPARANSDQYIDFILLDDMQLLLKTGAMGDLVYANLPEDVRSELTRSELGDMFSSYRHARFVEIFVTGDDPETVKQVAATTNEVMPEIVRDYLIPANNPDIPGTVDTLTPVSEPTQLTKERYVRIAAVTIGAFLIAMCIAGIAEWMRRLHVLKYGSRCERDLSASRS